MGKMRKTEISIPFRFHFGFFCLQNAIVDSSCNSCSTTSRSPPNSPSRRMNVCVWLPHLTAFQFASDILLFPVRIDDKALKSLPMDFIRSCKWRMVKFKADEMNERTHARPGNRVRQMNITISGQNGNGKRECEPLRLDVLDMRESKMIRINSILIAFF